MAGDGAGDEILLWPDGALDTAAWTEPESESFLPPARPGAGERGVRILRNVSRPRLSVHRPEGGRPGATAVVVCPGGAFHFLAIDHEGLDVARWLAGSGVTAFVLRYRVVPTPSGDGAAGRQLRENLSDGERRRRVIDPVRAMAFADGAQALRLVRQRAAEWDVDPGRVGILGFSAGGAVAASTALQPAREDRPDFAAVIYGAPAGDAPVPGGAPPLFLALAADDDMAVRTSLPLFTRWREAGTPAELHAFARGGHGFGMRAQGLPCDRWIDRFGEWLSAQGLLPGAAGAGST
jgi:acetyl esterase/lipase